MAEPLFRVDWVDDKHTGAIHHNAYGGFIKVENLRKPSERHYHGSPYADPFHCVSDVILGRVLRGEAGINDFDIDPVLMNDPIFLRWYGRILCTLNGLIPRDIKNDFCLEGRL